jgi:GNAT superfamily N-acetyltransferase
MPVVIRPAQSSDTTAILQLTRQLGYEVDETAASARLSRILTRRDQQVLVASADEIVGWIHVLLSEYVESDAAAVIGGLVVDRSHRRQGVGRLLVEGAEAWARRESCSIVRLQSSSTRADAHRFYEGLGYTNIKTQYSFVKSVAGTSQDLRRLVPHVEPSSR